MRENLTKQDVYFDIDWLGGHEEKIVWSASQYHDDGTVHLEGRDHSGNLVDAVVEIKQIVVRADNDALWDDDDEDWSGARDVGF